MPPPPPPLNVYPCLDWVPQGKAHRRPQKLLPQSYDMKMVIQRAKERALMAKLRLGHVTRQERLLASISRTDNSADNIGTGTRDDVSGGPSSTNYDDDAIMKEYGLDDYDDEAGDGIGHQHEGIETSDDAEDDTDDNVATTRAAVRGLASELASLTYHASNDDDPYLRESGVSNVTDEDEDDKEFIIKPTDNLIVAGHVHKDESSIKVYVYDNISESFYLHHDIIQSDYPCCVRWIGCLRSEAQNVLAAGYMHPEICLWDLDVVDVLEPIETLSGHKDAVIDIAWNNHFKKFIASGSADKHVRLWDLNECKSISNIELSGKVSALEFGIYEKSLLVAGDLNKNVSVIDTRSGSVVDTWQLTGEVEKVRWVPSDHTKFLVSDDQGYVYCFDTRYAASKPPIIKFRAHEISVTGLEFSPKCDMMLVTASADETVKVWDTKDLFKSECKGIEPSLVKEVNNLKVGSILSLRMNPDSLAQIAVGGNSKRNSLTTYDLASDREVRDRFFSDQSK